MQIHRILISIIVYIFSAFVVVGQEIDTIFFSINMKEYDKAAKNQLSINKQTDIYLFSIPILEWNEKAKEYSCGTDRLEHLISFKNNPNFQRIVFLDNNLLKTKDITESELRTKKRIQDSIDWHREIDNVPFSFIEDNLFTRFDEKQLKKVYKFHLKHPNSFIFRIAYFEGFWVITNNTLYRLNGNRLENANIYFYLMPEQYIKDIASGDGVRIGYRYIGCFNKTQAEYRAKKGKSILINNSCRR